jgi:hypothetical protein
LRFVRQSEADVVEHEDRMTSGLQSFDGSMVVETRGWKTVNQDDHLFVTEPCKKEELAFGIIYTVK